MEYEIEFKKKSGIIGTVYINAPTRQDAERTLWGEDQLECESILGVEEWG